MIQLKRVYDPRAKTDGSRFLVERLWPRGIKKENLKIDGWLKEAAPSTELRCCFGHDPARWEEFRKRYADELSARPDVWREIQRAASAGTVTLLFSSHDMLHNNAVALKRYLATHRLHPRCQPGRLV